MDLLNFLLAAKQKKQPQKQTKSLLDKLKEKALEEAQNLGEQKAISSPLLPFLIAKNHYFTQAKNQQL